MSDPEEANHGQSGSRDDEFPDTDLGHKSRSSLRAKDDGNGLGGKRKTSLQRAIAKYFLEIKGEEVPH